MKKYTVTLTAEERQGLHDLKERPESRHPLPNGASLRKSLGRGRLLGNGVVGGDGYAATARAERANPGEGATRIEGRMWLAQIAAGEEGG